VVDALPPVQVSEEKRWEKKGALSPFFGSKFARLQYAGDERFNLAYLRYTGQWWEVAPLLSLEECLSEIEGGGLFTP